MSWIQNRSKGTYLFLCTRNNPASTPITLKHEIGRNAVVAPNHCRLVDDGRFKKTKHLYIAVVSKHLPGGKPAQWISQAIGPGQFWVFDGKRVSEGKRRLEADCEESHGL